MLAYALASKPCSEVTNMLYLSSGVLCVGSSENQLEGFGKENRKYRLFPIVKDSLLTNPQIL